MAAAPYRQLYDIVIIDGYGAYVQTVWRNRREAQYARLRHDDWATVRQTVGCGASRGRDNQSVGLVGHEVFAIDAGPYGNHRGVVALQHRDVVQCEGIALYGLAVGLHLYHGVLLYGNIATVYLVESLVCLTRQDACQKAQPSHVDTDDGCALCANFAGSLQERTVTAK